MSLIFTIQQHNVILIIHCMRTKITHSFFYLNLFGYMDWLLVIQLHFQSLLARTIKGHNYHKKFDFNIILEFALTHE